MADATLNQHVVGVLLIIVIVLNIVLIIVLVLVLVLVLVVIITLLLIITSVTIIIVRIIWGQRDVGALQCRHGFNPQVDGMPKVGVSCNLTRKPVG